MRSALRVLPICLLLAPGGATALEITLAWDASPGAVGYVVFHGTQSGIYPDSIDVGNQTVWTWPSLANESTHYFAVQAYDAMGGRSTLSNAVTSFPSDRLPAVVNPPPGSPPAGVIDFVLQHETQGLLAAWAMNGTTLASQEWIWPNRVAVDWKVAAVADMDGDGMRDVVMQHKTSGGLLTWLMNGTSLRSQVWLTPSYVSDPNWRIVAAGDHDADAKEDLVFQHQRDGRLLVWLMSGTVLKRQEWFSPSGVADPNWRVVGTSDVDLNGTPDIFFQHQTTGGMVVWFMERTTLLRQEWIVPNYANPVWRIAAITDVNLDTNPDIVFQHQTDGRLLSWPLVGTRLIGSQIWLTPDRVIDPVWKLAAGR